MKSIGEFFTRQPEAADAGNVIMDVEIFETKEFLKASSFSATPACPYWQFQQLGRLNF
jgi:hypothetical protein